MIEVRISTDGIKVSGHAGYAPEGQDIVCSAVSVLTQNLVESIRGLTKDEIKCEISHGSADIEYGNLSEKALTLVDSFFIGIAMIADEYPDYVRIV